MHTSSICYHDKCEKSLENDGGKNCCLERGRLRRLCGTPACGHNHLEPSSSGGSDRPYPVGSDRPSSLQAGTLSWFLLLSGGVETKTTYF